MGQEKENPAFGLMMTSAVTIHLHTPQWKKLLHPYCKTVEVACASALGKKRAVAVVLADDAFVQKLNHHYRGKNKSTNVLAFPAFSSPLGEGDSYLGDIILAYETVVQEARAQGKTFKHHATHLLVHGCLHLLGHDHMRKKDAEAMEALEIKILAKLGISNPYL